MRITPLDFTVANDSLVVLTNEEQRFLDNLTAGYNMKELLSEIPSKDPALHPSDNHFNKKLSNNYDR